MSLTKEEVQKIAESFNLIANREIASKKSSLSTFLIVGGLFLASAAGAAFYYRNKKSENKIQQQKGVVEKQIPDFSDK